jgi:aspartate-semialdehyde dehydrogenase
VDRYHVGILGATGLVGQRLVERLVGHPWFELRAVAASERSAGRRYRDAVRWRLEHDPPDEVMGATVRRCTPDELSDCDLVLSALDSGVAAAVEPAFREAGCAVVSNSSRHRMDTDVPLLVPEINASHLSILETQRSRSGGFIVTNPNCAAVGLALIVAPLQRSFGVRRVIVATLQAVSGAGIGGPAALDLVDNVVPWIPGEEDKLESELAKILGEVDAGAIRPAEIVVSAHCHRVPVQDGHLEAVSIETARPVDPAEAVEVLRAFEGDLAGLGLPSAHARPIVVRDEPDRPQPRLDRNAAGGMAVVVGRVRACPVLGLKLELLTHNAVRGAAGAAILNAELLAQRGLLPRRGSA